MRLFLDKALPDYRLWEAENSESHWRDLVRSSIRQLALPQQHGLRDLSRKDQIAFERNLVHEICANFDTRPDRLEAWRERTGKGQSAFYRRLKELQSLRSTTTSPSNA